MTHTYREQAKAIVDKVSTAIVYAEAKNVLVDLIAAALQAQGERVEELEKDKATIIGQRDRNQQEASNWRGQFNNCTKQIAALQQQLATVEQERASYLLASVQLKGQLATCEALVWESVLVELRAMGRDGASPMWQHRMDKFRKWCRAKAHASRQGKEDK